MNHEYNHTAKTYNIIGFVLDKNKAKRGLTNSKMCAIY
jgi:hypothetical protein